MEYLCLTAEQVHEKSLEMCYRMVNDGERFTSVVFIAKGGYTIGKTISDYFGIPLFEAKAKRSGGALKEMLSPILKIVPSKIKAKLRALEEKKREEMVNSERKATLTDFEGEKAGDNILIVDDAVDTGFSMKAVADLVRLEKPMANIKTAALNVRTTSLKIIDTDYFIYKDYLLGGPWSGDSPEHKAFLEQYEQRR